MDLKFPSYFSYFLIAILFLGLSTRFLHFGTKIEDPHSWRQSDTAQYIWNFYTDGIDLFHPGVCWMGAHKTVILEFPLHQAFSASLYFLLGPRHKYARLITFIFFLVSLGYFFLILKRLFHESFALLATSMLSWLPLGIYYSRAIHIDFSAVAFGMMGFYYFLAWVESKRSKQLYISIIGFVLGFLIKAPYIFLFAFPLVYYISLYQHWKRVFSVIYLLATPIIAFILWRWHVVNVNQAAPDWFFIPGYVKFTEMSDWYFGSIAQRKDTYVWSVLAKGFLFHTVTPAGFVPFLLGLIIWRPTRSTFHPIFLQIWWWSAALYGLLFFNLAYFHDYYHIPFLFPSVALISLAMFYFLATFSFFPVHLRYGLCMLYITVFAYQAFQYSEKTYYKLDEQIIQAGKVVQAHTEEASLIITSAPLMDCRNPNWLYRARRLGWSIMPQHLSHSLIDHLQEEGATYIATLSSPLVDSLLPQTLDLTKLPLSLEKADTVYLYSLTP